MDEQKTNEQEINIKTSKYHKFQVFDEEETPACLDKAPPFCYERIEAFLPQATYRSISRRTHPRALEAINVLRRRYLKTQERRQGREGGRGSRS